MGIAVASSVEGNLHPPWENWAMLPVGQLPQRHPQRGFLLVWLTRRARELATTHSLTRILKVFHSLLKEREKNKRKKPRENQHERRKKERK
jgi:hypothetical protein